MFQTYPHAALSKEVKPLWVNNTRGKGVKPLWVNNTNRIIMRDTVCVWERLGRFI